MHIGLTYDLRSDYLREGFSEEDTAEFDKESTIEGIEAALHRLGHTTDRIGHLRQLMLRLNNGDRWELVFNICEGMYGIGREAQVPCLLDAFRIPYTFSDPLVLSLTLNKAMTKRIVRELGVMTPDFTVVHNPGEIEAVNLPFPLFFKPNEEGSGKGIDYHSLANTPAEFSRHCRSLLESLKLPVLVETFLPGREFTTGIIGTGSESSAIGTMEIVYNASLETKIYSYEVKNNYEKYVTYRIPEAEIVSACASLALKVWKGIGGKDAGRIDIRMDGSGNLNFIEINPLPGLNHITSDLPLLCYHNNLTFDFLIGKIIASAISRVS
jgi:D-alanine-D-alanine ligase